MRPNICWDLMHSPTCVPLEVSLTKCPYREHHQNSPATPWQCLPMSPSGRPMLSQSLQGLRNKAGEILSFPWSLWEDSKHIFPVPGVRWSCLHFRTWIATARIYKAFIQASSKKFCEKISAHQNSQVEFSFLSWIRKRWRASPNLGWGKARV